MTDITGVNTEKIESVEQLREMTDAEFFTYWSAVRHRYATSHYSSTQYRWAQQESERRLERDSS